MNPIQSGIAAAHAAHAAAAAPNLPATLSHAALSTGSLSALQLVARHGSDRGRIIAARAQEAILSGALRLAGAQGPGPRYEASFPAADGAEEAHLSLRLVPGTDGGHAAVTETALCLAVRPALVRPDERRAPTLRGGLQGAANQGH